MINIGIKGNGVSAFMSAKLLLDTKSSDFAIHIYDLMENNNSPRYVFLTPVSAKILFDVCPNIKMHIHDIAVKINKHSYSINNEIKSHEYDNTWMTNINFISNLMSESIKKMLTPISRSENCFITPSECDFNIISIGKNNNLEKRKFFGERKIVSVEVRINGNLSNTYFETTNDTWLYLAPINSNKAILQLAIPNSSFFNYDYLLDSIDKTFLIKSTIISIISSSIKQVNSSPSIFLEHPDYSILTGDALISYDPVSGYGLMNTMRSTILCIALIKLTIKSKTFSTDAYNYYMNRNIFSLRVHLQECVSLYSNINYEIWKRDIDLMNEGINYLKCLMNHRFKYNGVYHLKGFELHDQSNGT